MIAMHGHLAGTVRVTFQGRANPVRFTGGVDAQDKPGHAFFADALFVGVE